eukprot:Em0022g490a
MMSVEYDQFLRVSCSAIKVLGKKPAKQRFGRPSGTKELDGVVEGIGRKVKYLKKQRLQQWVLQNSMSKK